MDETIKAIIIQFPAIGVLLYMLNRLYNDWREDRDKSREERQDMLNTLYDVKHRVERLEIDALGDRSPTLHRKPIE